jgi:hypothetical protein
VLDIPHGAASRGLSEAAFAAIGLALARPDMVHVSVVLRLGLRVKRSFD